MTIELDSVTAETMLAFFREQVRTQPGAELQGALAARLANAIQAARSEERERAEIDDERAREADPAPGCICGNDRGIRGLLGCPAHPTEPEPKCCVHGIPIGSPCEPCWDTPEPCKHGIRSPMHCVNCEAEVLKAKLVKCEDPECPLEVWADETSRPCANCRELTRHAPLCPDCAPEE